ncbi:LamG-like jellyroll fold domain-containing protein [Tenacibaculum maritimum]|uniref:LamG-like jellyroll fold domain-containing protein n=1 Tax=Tenacibaculum maritimum TaxID=107401 RepID=UPI003876FC8D
MNSKIHTNKIYLMWCLLVLSLSIVGQSIERPPVLILQGHNGYTTHFDTQNKVTSQLLETGVKGQATIEFWVMKGHMENIVPGVSKMGAWKFSNLLSRDQEFSLIGSGAQLEAKMGGTSQTISLGRDNEEFWENKWHHIAVTINTEASSLRLFVDGAQKANLTLPSTGFSPEKMYLMVTGDEQLSIAEYRAWNRARTLQQIDSEKSLTYSNADDLKSLNSNGLVIAYAKNDFVEQYVSNLPIQQTLWDNLVASLTGVEVPASSRVISKISKGEEEVTLAKLTTEADHPIYSLKDVYLYATDGEGRKSSGKRIIQLRWPHISGATNYIIQRRNIGDPSSRFATVDTYVPTSSDAVSSYLTFDDDEILPNELYRYRVTAEGVEGSESGEDNGFVFANGEVRGSVETANRVATQDVLIEAKTLKEAVLPGKALRFSKGSSPVDIHDVSLFEIGEGEGTIEFWYRNDVTNNTEVVNTVFKLGEGEIRMGAAQMEIRSRETENNPKAITYLTTAKPNDGYWHHYAFTFDATGGAVYIDGGVSQPTDKENPIVANGTTNKKFITGLNRASRFSFNAQVAHTYDLDEIRIWGGKKNATQIYKYWNLILGANDLPGLAAYYRFDMEDATSIYNQAAFTLGKFKGVSITPLTTTTQPFQRVAEGDAFVNKPIVYGVYTNDNGLYSFNSINTGKQNITSANNYLGYEIIPSKPNNEFSPVSRTNNIERTLSPEQPNETSFTNTSQYDISGKVVYLVANGGESVEYPTIQSTGIKLNGKEVTSVEEGSLVRTDKQGVYRITGEPKRHSVSVGQPRLEGNSVAIDRSSLDFKNKGYAVSSESIAVASDEGFTWSGFIKPDVELPNAGGNTSVAKIPELQTVLHWGSLKLELRNNNQLVLLSGNTELISKVIEGQSEYTFFGITKDVENSVIGLWVNGDYQTKAYTGEAIDSKIYVGASYVSETEMKDFSLANMDILEFRNAHYNAPELNKIKDGNIVAKDEQYLKLSYAFEHKIGTRAINLAVASGTKNNYLLLEGGAYFNETSSSKYLRKFEFDYVAFKEGDSNKLVNPENNKEYLFNLTEPTSNINFENITRRSFVGNIVIPCNNSVGNWTGTITRTDIAFPRYEKTITASNFNDENNLFTVHDLLPGQYRVELTREGTTDVVQSSIIDLRGGNKSYDFPYRNELQAELTLYDVSKEELESIQEMSALESKKIDPTCGDDSTIYKLESGKSILAVVSVFEEYDGSKCYVEGAEVGLNGKMILAPTKGTTDASGKQGFLTFTGSPNFIGDYLRDLNIVVAHKGRNITVKKSSYITGAQRGNENFTLTDPTVGFVLYDPPGDASSSTLSRGASYSYSSSVGGGGDYSLDTSITVGADVEVQTVTLAIAAPLGVGVGQGIISTITESEAVGGGNFNIATSHRHTSGSGRSVSLSQSISTSSDATIVGQDADVFIGTSRVLTFGTGKTLLIDENCQPVIDYDKTVMTADKFTPFVYTRQDIEDNIIVKLQDLLISRYDQVFSTSKEEIAKRNSLENAKTIEGFNIDINSKDTDKELVNYVYQIQKWKEIVKRKSREEQLKYMNDHTRSFAETTSDLKSVGEDLGSTIEKIDTQLSFSGQTSTTYTLSRANEENKDNSTSTSGGGGGSFETNLNIFGVAFNLNTDIKISGTVDTNNSTGRGNSREDSFTLSDGDAGDQFSVRIARDKMYDTPIFYTVAGQSSCPFESGTVPREGVEIVIDSAEKYGSGDESILYNLTLRNTQVAKDRTRKTYIVGMAGASNGNGAQVFLNESPIFEPGTSSPISFGLDGDSETGVQKEIKAQLKITRGLDAPEEISYEDIKIRIYSECEQAGDGFRSYRQDEYAEVGVVPFQEISVTAHFKGACIGEITTSAPEENWVVNNTSGNKLDVKFRIPEVVNDQVAEDFSVALEYALPGNNKTFELKKLSLEELKENMDSATGIISYQADVSSLSDGAYNFRIAPVCANEAAGSRKNPTAFVKGTIARVAPIVIKTNPINGGVLKEGNINVEFNSAINPLTVVNSSFSLRGILGGLPQDLVAAEFDNVDDEVIVPHRPEFNLEAGKPFTIEMWVNPSSLPAGSANAQIVKKGDNFSIALTSEGKIKVNNTVESAKALQPFNWTHVTVVYDGVNTATVYYNGVSVGGGAIAALVTNEEAIEIAKNNGGTSFVGKLDEMRIWTNDRSPSDIVKYMDEQLVGNEVGLVAYFVFDDNALKGANGAPDEAIRDYTGNALATTQKGLSFVRGISKAAPLDVTKVAKDLQYQLEVSNNDTQVHIIPVFDASFVEGAQLTAMIRNRRLEDPFGNQLKGKSWSFIVNRNTIAWSQNNLTVRQEQGTSTTVSSIDLDNSKGGSPVKYRFKQLPSWLTVEKDGTEIKANSFQNLAASFVERDLEFVVAPYLNPGKHAADVYIEVFQTVDGKDKPIGVEAFHLEVIVTCAVPDFAEDFNSNKFISNMSIVGSLIIDDTPSIDSGDIVVAYLNDEYRGEAHVDASGLVNLSIFGNIGEEGTLSFRVWDASECTEYKGIKEVYSFEFKTIGKASAPVTLTVGERVSRRISLEEGFQEVSFNLKGNNTDMTLPLSSIKGFQGGDKIHDAVSFKLIATVNNDGTFNLEEGETSELDVRKGYLLYSEGSKFVTIEGVHVSLDTNIAVAGDMEFTSIPYFPSDLQTIPIALRSLNSTTVSDGDRIERRGLHAEYKEGEGWIGSLTHLTPGLGYKYKAHKEGILNYSGIATKTPRSFARSVVAENTSEAYLSKAKAINWKVNRNQFPSFMYAVATLESLDLDVTKEYVIAAFVNGEIRGVAKPTLVDDVYHYFMGIGGFAEGDVAFKLFDGEQILSLDNSLSFERGKQIGDLESPYVLNFTAKSEEPNTKVSKGYRLGQNIPNPVKNHTRITYQVAKDEFVDISLYNALGQKVHTFIAKKVKGNKLHHIDFNLSDSEVSLKSGVYIYKLTTASETMSERLIVE